MCLNLGENGNVKIFNLKIILQGRMTKTITEIRR